MSSEPGGDIPKGGSADQGQSERPTLAEAAAMAELHGQRVDGIIAADQAADAANADIPPTERGQRLSEIITKNGWSEAHAKAFIAAGEGVTDMDEDFGPAEQDAIVNAFAELNPPVKRQHIKEWIDAAYPDMDDPAKDRLEQILSRFEPMSDEEYDEDHKNISDKRADRMHAKAQGVRDRAQQQADAILKDLALRQDIDEDQKDEVRGQITGLLTKITDWFGEDEPGRNWSRRIGKTLYIALMAFFLLIIAEMNLINKMSKTKR